MEIRVTRTITTREALIGDLSIDGVFECYTLENRDLAIPLGSYPVGIYNSPHAAHLLPILRNVPGRDAIELHCGNTYADSRGCILVGKSHTSGILLDSHLAFAQLFPKIQGAINAGEDVRLVLV